MFRSASACFAQHAHTVGVVNHDPEFVFLPESHDLIQRAEVPLHGKDAVDHDHLVLVPRPFQDPVEILHVVVLELSHLAQAEPQTVHDGCVINPVADSHIASAHHGG